LFSSDVAIGTTLSFIVQGVKNPISPQPVSNIVVSSVDNTTLNGVIDTAKATLTST